jgi:hypothetical protein
MKKYSAILPLAALVFSACSEPTAPVGDDMMGGEITSIVLTTGVVAPLVVRRTPIAFSTLDGATPSLGGSSTTPVALNGDACETFPARTLKILYALSGNQASPASVKVNANWDWNGSSFVAVGAATTLNLPAKTGGGDATHEVDVTITNSSESGSGTSQIVITPFDLVTNLADPAGQRLTLGANSSATIHVAFNDCTPTNTAPSITVPSNITAEAVTSAGAEVMFSLTLSDAEDDESDLQVECAVDGSVVSSGDEFAIGASEVTCRVTDNGGLYAEDSFFIYVQDTGAPVFDTFPTHDTDNPFVIIADNITGGTVDMSAFTITAKDFAKGTASGPEVSTPVTITCEIDGEPADGYSLAIGYGAWVECTAADNASFRAPVEAPALAPAAPNVSAVESFYVVVGLDVSGVGFLSPLKNTGPYSAHKRGSAIPHKFPAPKYADGSLATDLAAGLNLGLNHAGGVGIGETTTANDPAAGSTAWRYDVDAGHYIFNAKTGADWKTGDWLTTVKYGAVTIAQTMFELRK